VVGLGIHSVGEIEEEIRALHTDMTQFDGELNRQLFLQDDAHRGFDIPKPGTPEDKLSLYHSVWRPIMNEWLSFYADHHDSVIQNLPFSGSWDRTQEFRERFIRARDKAKEMKFSLMTPDPVAPKKDIDAGDVAKNVVKIVAYGGLGLVGLILAIKVAQGSGGGSRL
jgi:hypothetical protein